MRRYTKRPGEFAALRPSRQDSRGRHALLAVSKAKRLEFTESGRSSQGADPLLTNVTGAQYAPVGVEHRPIH